MAQKDKASGECANCSKEKAELQGKLDQVTLKII